MSKIIFCRDEIIRLINEHMSDSNIPITVDSCNDPIVYINTLNPTSFPLILVSYKSSLINNSKMYPGTCSFEIYFIDIKKEKDDLFNLMEKVYLFFSNNPIQIAENGDIVTGQKLIYQNQSYYNESKEHIVYSQKYNLLIP